jgi:AcrR family transcriptional regulator
MANDARRAQLLTLGIEMFSAHSWDDVQIEDVARAAGISKGLLYHYFPTKRVFYAEVVREAARRLVAETDMPESMAPLERLHAGLARYLDFAERHAPAYTTLLKGGIGSDTSVAAIVDETRTVLMTRILRGAGVAQPPALLRLTLRGWVGFVEATSVEWLERRDLARDELLALWARALIALVPGA